MEFKRYKRKHIAELRPVTQEDIEEFINEGEILWGLPKKGDMIARNPENPNDQWLVAKEYFEANFEEI